MTLETSLIIGLIGFSGILIYASTTINPGEDNDETGEEYDPLLGGLKLFLFLLGLIALTVIPALQWHLIDLNQVGCTTNCLQYNHTKTVINTVMVPAQYIITVMVFFIGLFVVVRVIKGVVFYMKKILNKPMNSRGRERRRL